MNLRIMSFVFLTWFTVFPAFAVMPLPSNVIDFTSKPGLALLKKNATENTLNLLQHYITEHDETYCGVASAVMALNSIKTTLPDDAEHPPYQYFTQTNFFTPEVSKIITAEVVAKQGMTLEQLVAAIKTHGVHAEAYHADKLSLEKSRDLIVRALNEQKPVIANVLRTGLNEVGGGHHSPIAAYDKETDRFLFLDVARYKYHAGWISASDLWNAINTKDNGVSRGFIIVGR